MMRLARHITYLPEAQKNELRDAISPTSLSDPGNGIIDEIELAERALDLARREPTKFPLMNNEVWKQIFVMVFPEVFKRLKDVEFSPECFAWHREVIPWLDETLPRRYVFWQILFVEVNTLCELKSSSGRDIHILSLLISSYAVDGFYIPTKYVFKELALKFSRTAPFLLIMLFKTSTTAQRILFHSDSPDLLLFVDFFNAECESIKCDYRYIAKKAFQRPNVLNLFLRLYDEEKDSSRVAHVELTLLSAFLWGRCLCGNQETSSKCEDTVSTLFNHDQALTERILDKKLTHRRDSGMKFTSCRARNHIVARKLMEYYMGGYKGRIHPLRLDEEDAELNNILFELCDPSDIMPSWFPRSGDKGMVYGNLGIAMNATTLLLLHEKGLLEEFSDCVAMQVQTDRSLEMLTYAATHIRSLSKVLSWFPCVLRWGLGEKDMNKTIETCHSLIMEEFHSTDTSEILKFAAAVADRVEGSEWWGIIQGDIIPLMEKTEVARVVPELLLSRPFANVLGRGNCLLFSFLCRESYIDQGIITRILSKPRYWRYYTKTKILSSLEQLDFPDANWKKHLAERVTMYQDLGSLKRMLKSEGNVEGRVKTTLRKIRDDLRGVQQSLWDASCKNSRCHPDNTLLLLADGRFDPNGSMGMTVAKRIASMKWSAARESVLEAVLRDPRTTEETKRLAKTWAREWAVRVIETEWG